MGDVYTDANGEHFSRFCAPGISTAMTSATKRTGGLSPGQNGRPLFIYTHEDRPGMIDGLDVGTQGGGRFYAIFAEDGTLNAKGPTAQATR